MKISIIDDNWVPTTALTSSYGNRTFVRYTSGVLLKSYLLVLDVDSTMIEQEVIELLAERVGLREEVKIVTDQAMAGQINFSEALLQRVRLLEGLSSEVFIDIQSQIQVTEGVIELIEAIHNAGGKVGAISGGFSQILEPLATRLGLDCYLANELEFIDGALTGNIAGAMVDGEMKAKTLFDWANRFGIEVEDTVAVGDGANDVKMLTASGFGVAFRPKQVLREFADLVIEGNSLRPLITELELRSS